MTPKEKAKEILSKFLHEAERADRYNYNLESDNIFIAKKCSLIAVDEIINTNALIEEETYVETTIYLEFWKQVKTELENV